MAKHSKGKLSHLEWKIIICWKCFVVSCLYCRLIFPMDKAIIHGKRFMIEKKTVKTTKVFSLKRFAYMVNTVAFIVIMFLYHYVGREYICLGNDTYIFIGNGTSIEKSICDRI